MGNSNEKNRMLYEHEEVMEHLRNQQDLKKGELLLKEKTQELGLEKYRMEIGRLVKLDKNHFDLELQKAKQFHEREMKKINNIHEENILKENNIFNYFK